MKKLLKKTSAIITFATILFLQAAPTTFAAITVTGPSAIDGTYYTPMAMMDMNSNPDPLFNELELITTVYPTAYEPADTADSVGLVYFDKEGSSSWSEPTELITPVEGTNHLFLTRPKMATSIDRKVGVVWQDETDQELEYIGKANMADGGAWDVNATTIATGVQYTYPSVGFHEISGEQEPFIIAAGIGELQMLSGVSFATSETITVSLGNGNVTGIEVIVEEATGANIIHIFTSPNPANVGGQAFENSSVHYIKGTEIGGSSGTYTWSIPEEVITGITDSTNVLAISASIDSNDGDLRVIARHSPSTGNSFIYFISQDLNSFSGQTPIEIIQSPSDIGDSGSAPQLVTYYDGVKTNDYVAVTTGNMDDIVLLSSTIGFDYGSIIESIVYPSSFLQSGANLAYMTVTPDSINAVHGSQNDGTYMRSFGLGIDGYASGDPVAIAFVTSTDSVAEVEGEISNCETAGNGISYVTSAHSYVYDDNTYDTGDGDFEPYSTWNGNSGYRSFRSSLNTSLNCLIGETPNNWHLILVKYQLAEEYGGANTYQTYYLGDGDYPFTDDPTGRTAIQTLIDSNIGPPFVSGTVEAYRLNAFTYAAGEFTFFDTSNDTPGSPLILKRGSDGETTDNIEGVDASVSDKNLYETVAISLGYDAEEEEPEPEGESMPSCTGVSPDGDTYTIVDHNYTYNEALYGDMVFLVYLPSESGFEALHTVTEETANVSCTIQDQNAEENMNWHLALLGAGTDHYIMYFNAEDYLDQSSIQSFVTGVNPGLTVDYIKFNALTFSGTAGAGGEYAVVDPMIAGTGDYLGEQATWTGTEPDILVTPESGTGEPVPEFKDYMLIITIALALGMAYTIIPTTKPTRA